MGKTGQPRKGSMQFWPRKRAKKICPRVRSWPEGKEPSLLGFAGFKAGMTHVVYTDNRKASTTKGDDIASPVTVIECPPIKIAAIKFYKKSIYGLKLKTQINAPKWDKELERKTIMPKKVDEKKITEIKPEDYTEIRVLAYTQPKLTGIGSKKPELFELGLGGNVAEQFAYAKDNLGKEVSVKDVFKEGEQIDIHAVTIGKGFQGPVKRFGITVQGRKKEKAKRNPGSLGPWKGQGHVMYRVAHAGQTGFHTRVEYNKCLMKIGEEGKEVTPRGGFLRYGEVKNPFILVKGSVGGSKKRIVRLVKAIRPNAKVPTEAPTIQEISLASKQGNRVKSR